MTVKDTTQAILRRAGAFFSGTAISRVTGLIREIAMGAAFGATSSVAAFVVAFRLSHLLRRILGDGAMQTAFIPQFVAARTASEERALSFFQNLSGALTVLLITLIVAGEGILGLLLSSNLLEAEWREICTLTMLMLPSLLFICLGAVNGALLQCEGRYFLVSGAPVVFNLIWIAAVVVLSPWTDSEAMPWLAVAITLACVAQWMVTVPSVRSITGWRSPWTAWRQFDRQSPDLRSLLKALSLGILGVSAQQINGAIDAIFATYAAPEGPALLWFANRVQQLPLGLFGVALSGALLPALSRAVKENDLPRSRHYLDFSIRQAALLIVPATFGLLATGGAIINLLFGHGNFSQAATADTTWCLWAYALGLPAATLTLLLGPGFYAHGDYATPTRGVILALIANISLNVLVVGVFNMGPTAVAAATTVASWLNVAYLHVKLRRRLGPYLTSASYSDIGNILLASLIASLATTAASLYFELANPLISALTHTTIDFPRSLVEQISQGALAGLIFVATWLLVARLLSIDLLSAFRREVGS